MIKKMLPYLSVFVLAFYVVPLICIKITPPYSEGLIVILLTVLPAICFIVSLVYGILNKFKPFQLLFPIFVSILFIPAMFIFYNSSAWIYLFVYMVITFCGNGIGYIIAYFNKRSK